MYVCFMCVCMCSILLVRLFGLLYHSVLTLFNFCEMADVYIHSDSDINAATLEQLIFAAAITLRDYAALPNGVLDRRGAIDVRVDVRNGLVTLTFTAPVKLILGGGPTLMFTIEPFIAKPIS